MNVRVGLCVLLVCALVAPSGVSLVTADDGDGVAVQEQSLSNLQQEQPPNNTSVRHRNPQSVREDGDVEGLQRWLTDRLTERLDRGAIQLSEGEYDAARRIVGDEYDDQLGKLVDVAGETETTRSLRETRRSQRETAEAAAEYRETLAEYREARRNGNETRARNLGRQLERSSARVSRSANETVDGYDRLGSQLDADFSESAAAIQQVSDDISSTQVEVRDEIFVRTELTATTDGGPASFRDPLTVSGRLTMDNGTAIADTPIRIMVGNRTMPTETNGDGGFSVDYRPTRLSANATEVRVEYRPAGVSVFLNSSTTVPIAVESVTPTLTVERSPDSVAYDETLTVAGRVSVDDVGASVPIAVSVDGRPVARTVADSDGVYNVSTRLPANVPPGERTVRVRVDQSGRAIERTEATTTVTVRATETALSLRAGRVDDSRLRAAGQLTTADGRALANRTVDLSVDGSVVTSVRTNATGQYAATLRRPVVDGNATVNATFTGAGTSLQRSVASELITGVDTLPAGGGVIGAIRRAIRNFLTGSPVGPGGSATDVRVFVLRYPLLALSFVLGAVVLAISAAFAVLTGRGPFGDDSDDTDLDGVAPAAGTIPADTDEGPSDPGVAIEALLARAREQIASGTTNAGVITAYAAVRHRLAGRADSDRGYTHWEFYQRVRDQLGSDRSGVLREITEAYERAAFAPGAITVDNARQILDRATSFDDGEEQAAD